MDNQNNNEVLVYTVQEVQELLGVSRKTAYKICNSSLFPIKRIGQKLLIPKDGFHVWLSQSDR